MARHALLLLVAALVASATAAAAGHAVHGHTTDAAGWRRAGGISSCRGTVEECLGEYEVGGDGVVGLRRRLDDAYPTQYISYAALMRDSVPCSVPGASYYNCQPGADANPYTRGCSAITQCRD